MEKIVLLSSQTEKDRTLVKCLEMLFPECEIVVNPQSPQNGEYSHVSTIGITGKALSTENNRVAS